MTNQSASGQHGHCDGGHGHGCPGAEGEDGVVPPLAVLLLPGWTPRRGVVSVNSRLNQVFSLYIEQGKGLSFAWLNFGFFLLLTLTF